MKLYCDLHVSECWNKNREKIIERLRNNTLLPHMYVLALSSGKQNNLEFYSGILLKQHIFSIDTLFVIGIADGYGECLKMTEKITEEVFNATGSADIRQYIIRRQNEYEKAGQ